MFDGNGPPIGAEQHAWIVSKTWWARSSDSCQDQAKRPSRTSTGRGLTLVTERRPGCTMLPL